jgi:metal-sulfur cluster biosynthetic enzyme
MDTARLEAAIRSALAGIHDPCSVAAGRPLSILAMGLVPGWELEGATLRIRFTVTNGLCTMAPHFIEAARTALLAIPGVEAVEASLDTSVAWAPLAPIAMHGVPQAWRQRAAQA